MTAVEWLIQELITRDRFVPDFLEQQAKEMEKQQIIDAYYEYELYLDREFRFQQGGQAKILTFEQWYETYGSKGSDETKINLVEIPQEQLEKERNPNYKYFDIDEHTSSQTEISDEEIEKEADKYSDAYDCPSKIKLCKHDIKAAFINSIGWYREQLKKKQ